MKKLQQVHIAKAVLLWCAYLEFKHYLQHDLEGTDELWIKIGWRTVSRNFLLIFVCFNEFIIIFESCIVYPRPIKINLLYSKVNGFLMSNTIDTLVQEISIIKTVLFSFEMYVKATAFYFENNLKRIFYIHIVDDVMSIV